MRHTSRGSSIAFLVTMICLGCSSTGNERMSAATSSAVFHLASWNRQIRNSLLHCFTWYIVLVAEKLIENLRKTLLACPHGSVNDLEEQLSCARIEDEDRSVDRFRGQVSFEGLVDGHAIHICVIDKPEGYISVKKLFYNHNTAEINIVPTEFTEKNPNSINGTILKDIFRINFIKNRT